MIARNNGPASSKRIHHTILRPIACCLVIVLFFSLTISLIATGSQIRLANNDFGVAEVWQLEETNQTLPRHGEMTLWQDTIPIVLYSGRSGVSITSRLSEIFTATILKNGTTIIRRDTDNELFDIYPAIASEPGGRLHCTWLQEDAPQTARPTVVYTQGNRSTWYPRVKVSSEPADWDPPDIAVSTNGTIFIVWRNSAGVRLSISSDGGKYFTTINASRTTWKDLGVINHTSAPQLAVDPQGFAHVVWCSHWWEDSEKITYAQFDATGRLVDARILGNLSKPSIFGISLAIVSDPQGALHVSWFDNGSLFYGTGEPGNLELPQPVLTNHHNTSSLKMGVAGNGSPYFLWDEVTYFNNWTKHTDELFLWNGAALEPQQLIVNSKEISPGGITVDAMGMLHAFWITVWDSLWYLGPRDSSTSSKSSTVSANSNGVSLDWTAPLTALFLAVPILAPLKRQKSN